MFTSSYSRWNAQHSKKKDRNNKERKFLIKNESKTKTKSTQFIETEYDEKIVNK